MGYTTEFKGRFEITPGLTDADRKFLIDFNAARHGSNLTPDPDVPGFYCQWTVQSEEPGVDFLVWDGGEKFYNYVDWLEYLLENVFKPKGYTLNGEVTWQGEDPSDIGKIEVDDNVVNVKRGRVVYG